MRGIHLWRRFFALPLTSELDALYGSNANPILRLGESQRGDEELEREIEKARGYVYPHQEETTLAMKYTVTALNADSVKDLGVSFPVYDESDNDRRNDGVEITAIGTAYHRVMELIDFSLDDLGAVTKAIDQMVADGLLREEQRALVKDNEILKALMNPVIKSAAGEKCYHEQPNTRNR